MKVVFIFVGFFGAALAASFGKFNFTSESVVHDVGRISDMIRKNSVPKRGIKLQSLTIWASITTARPVRTLIAVTFTPSMN